MHTGGGLALRHARTGKRWLDKDDCQYSGVLGKRSAATLSWAEPALDTVNRCFNDMVSIVCFIPCCFHRRCRITRSVALV